MEAMEGRTLLSTYTVTNTNDSGSGSLRQAILDSNKSSSVDTIKFAIGSGFKSIAPKSHLPGVEQPVTIDATTQPGFSGKPIVELNGTNAGSGAYGLKLIGSGITVKGLVVNRFKGDGMFLYNHGGDKVTGCWIGVDKTGTIDQGNGGKGIFVQSQNNTIGGAAAAERNVISGNENAGVYFYLAAASHNKVVGNYIGTDYTGSKQIKNYIGVQINGASYVTVGGTAAGSRNVISGNVHDGVLMVTTGSKYNTVQGNYIGTNAAGTAKIGNGWYGVEISQHDNVVGGTTAAARNVISGNGMDGVSLYLASSYNNKVQGNYIGTDYTGTKDLGNAWAGVSITNDAHNNLVGGSTSSACNVIAGNEQYGVGIYNHSVYNTVQMNCIGVASNGKSLPNTKNPISIWISDHNSILSNKIVISTACKTQIMVSSGLTTTISGNTLYGTISAGLKVI